MILLFMFAFGAHLIMLFCGFILSAAYNSRIYQNGNTRESRRISKIRLRRHWRITWILFALYIYAGLNL